MPRFARTLAWVLVSLVAVAPLSAAVYKVSLTNGSSFETRYQPEDASWDKGKIVFLDECGNLIALAKSDVEKVESDFAAKGYGAMLDNTTMALGWAPNDAAEEGATGAPQPEQQQQPNVTYNQFVEPDQMQGMPANWVGYPINNDNGSSPTPAYVAPSNPAAGTPAPEAPPPTGDKGM